MEDATSSVINASHIPAPYALTSPVGRYYPKTNIRRVMRKVHQGSPVMNFDLGFPLRVVNHAVVRALSCQHPGHTWNRITLAHFQRIPFRRHRRSESTGYVRLLVVKDNQFSLKITEFSLGASILQTFWTFWIPKAAKCRLGFASA